MASSGYGDRIAPVKPQKVLIAGDVRGDFGLLYSKVIAAHQRHGPFSAVFCVGDFLGDGDDPASSLRPYMAGEKKTPITTYLLNARVDCEAVRALLEGSPSGEIAKDIVLLAGPALTVLSGLRVAYDARPASPPEAHEGPTRPGEDEDGFAETEELDAAFMRKGHIGVDLLLTCDWPRGVGAGLEPAQSEQAAAALAKAGQAELGAVGARRVARLSAAARPRYHFAGGGAQAAWVRAPYANWEPGTGAAAHVTRFVALAPVGNAHGGKWLHALNLVPMGRMDAAKLTEQPEGTTRNPYEGEHVHLPAAPQPEAGLPPMPPFPPGPPPPGGYLPVPPGAPRDGPPLPPGPRPPTSSLAAAFGLPALPPQPQPGEKRPLEDGEGGGRQGRARGAKAGPHARAADDAADVDVQAVDALIGKREAARAERDFAAADTFRAELRDALGVLVDDKERTWRVAPAEGRSASAAARPWVGRDCWFCLASAHFEAHLVVAVGEEGYVAMAKGPLTRGSCIVLPITHASSAAACTPEALSEMLQLRNALGACFAAEGLETVVFERRMPPRGDSERDHLHLQLVPLPLGLPAEAVRAGLEAEGERVGIAFEHCADASWPPKGLLADEGYLWYKLPGGGGALLHRMSTSIKRHPMMFARQALARAFGLAERADWKVCMPDPRAAGNEGKTVAALEAAEAEELKSKFAKFDPTA